MKLKNMLFREIKFRAWDTENNVYLDPDEAFLIANNGLPGRFTQRFGYTVDENLVLEQYVGLKDKNGKEIYEGDILRWKHFYGITGENIETIAKVYWEEKDASFVVGDWFEPLGHLVDKDEVEVVGNIHENRELLGGKE